ncbi:MAG: hypothetical protein RIM80_28430, partial [Alphaproteobacteria bacterium]
PRAGQVLFILDGLDELALPDSAASAQIYERFMRFLEDDLTALREEHERRTDWRALVLGRPPAAAGARARAGASRQCLFLLPLKHPMPEDRAEIADRRKLERAEDGIDARGADRRAEAWARYRERLGLTEAQAERALSDAFVEINTEPLFLGQLALLGAEDNRESPGAPGRLDRADDKASLFHELLNL